MRSAVLVIATLLGILPAAAGSWIQKVAGLGLGNPLTSNPLNGDILYGAVSTNRIYISRDRGYTWATFANVVSGGGIIKSISISPLDTLDILAGMESGGGAYDRVMKSTDGGLTWTQTWGGTMSYYGQPVEFNPAHPDTAYVMGLDTLWRSTDFGSTWDTVSIGAGFNAWCDAAIRPDNAAIMYIGDNASGIWKTTNHGETWIKKYTTIGEIPSIDIDPFNPLVAYATKYSGGGGFLKTTDGGETWNGVSVPSGSRDTWWTVCSPKHPGYVYYGTYTADTSALGIYISRNSGASWTKIFTGIPSGSPSIYNYGLLTLDSLTLITLQGSGIYKYQYPTTIGVVSPEGGEHFVKDSVHTVSWTSAGLYAVDVEFSTNAGSSWTTIADSVPTSQNSTDWLIPDLVSESCLVRVSDARFTPTADTSGSYFTITNAFLTVLRPDGGETWDVESYEEIVWNSVSLDSVRIDFSSDSGDTWDLIAQVPAELETYDWYVPQEITEEALIRITGVDDTTITDQSDGVFSIFALTTFLTGLRVADAGAGADTIHFGNLVGATDDIDTAFGEWELGPPPGPGDFDTRWLIEGTNGSPADVRDTMEADAPPRIYNASLQVGFEGGPLDLTWSPDELENGTFLWKYSPSPGVTLGGNMRRDSVLSVPMNKVTFTIVQCPTREVVIPADGGWKLVSASVETGTNEASSLFPFSSSGAFLYDGGYVKAETLTFGAGYWVKTYKTTLAGCALESETLDVSDDWNIVGALTSPVAVSSIITTPDSIIDSPFYGYDDDGYYLADSLMPGEGYWVKLTSAGTMIIPAATAAQPSHRAQVSAAAGHRTGSNGSDMPAGRSSLSIRRSAGGTGQRLFFGAGGSSGAWELPPPPPSSPGNIAFPGNRSAFFYAGTGEFFEAEVQIPDPGPELFLDWDIDSQDNFTYILMHRVETQTVSSVRLDGRGRTGLPVTSASRFILRAVRSQTGSGSDIREFRLGEFYPNPFNPETRVAYSLPARSRVTVRVYSVAGEEVARPLDTEVDEGHHSFSWDGTGRTGDTGDTGDNGRPVASGVYFISMEAVPIAASGGGANNPAHGMTHAVRKVVFLR